ncbi:MAG: DUF3037 domain-containing protein [Acidobacteria bacterium]|nr:DUF3037 domain-containing protein [Acidobacteriota bacterium]
MPAPSSYDYAVIRVVPRVDREELINAGVVLFCLQRRFLGALVRLDEARLRALWPDLDLELVRERLEAFVRVAEGDPAGGPIARLTQRERFHWLTSPRSTIVQVSPVHSGLCEEPEAALERLFGELVATGASPGRPAAPNPLS